MVCLKPEAGSEMFDISFMPSLECNLFCSFCMYDASPWNTTWVDLAALREFIETIDFAQINSFGLYGGEPSISMALYDRVLSLLPKEIKKFVIRFLSQFSNLRSSRKS